MKKIKLQSKLHLAKSTVATLSATDQHQIHGGGSGLTPCLENTDTNCPMSEMNCYSDFYKCGWRTWINCGAYVFQPAGMAAPGGESPA